jgi:hypothetical protein
MGGPVQQRAGPEQVFRRRQRCRVARLVVIPADHEPPSRFEHSRDRPKGAIHRARAVDAVAENAIEDDGVECFGREMAGQIERVAGDVPARRAPYRRLWIDVDGPQLDPARGEDGGVVRIVIGDADRQHCFGAAIDQRGNNPPVQQHAIGHAKHQDP